MTLLFVDGFDHYVTADFTRKWRSSTGTNVTIVTSGGRRNGGYVSLENTGYSNAFVAVTNLATIICGFGFRPTATSGSILKFYDATTAQCTLRWNLDGSLAFYRGDGSTLLGSSAAGLITTNSWAHVEVKVSIHNTTGTVEVRVNGSASPVINLSSQNTRSSANNYATSVSITATSGLVATHFDDFYVCDTNGSTNNNFLGDCRVDTLYPTSDGNYTAFTPSTGSDHFALVDETAPNGSDYNDGVAVNDRDSYGFGNLSALTSQTVYGVQVNAAALKDDAGSKSVATFARSVSTNTDGASTPLSTALLYVSQIFEQDPDAAAAWTESTVNAAEFGVKVTA